MTIVDSSLLDALHERLRRTLGAEVPPPTRLRPFGDGHAGYTYALDLGAHTYVLRLSPPGARIAGPADVGRQGRIMAAVERAGAPAPTVVDADSRPVLDGRAFVLMEMCPGVGWETARLTMSDREIAAAAIDTLRTLQAITLAETGLAGEGSISIADEIDRWSALAERCPPETRSLLGRLARALRESLPRPVPACLCHGDFHYGNLLIDRGRVRAVLDWEIACVGDPLVDLACLLVASLRRRYRPEPNPTGDLEIAADELVALYGADPDRASWFCAQSCFKYAAIIGYNLGLHLRGKRIDPIYAELGRTMRGLPLDGLALIEGGLDARR